MANQIIPADGLGKFEGNKVHALTITIKGSLPLMRKVHEGQDMEVVLSGVLGPPKFTRNKDGLLIRQHDLVAEIAGEARDTLAEEVCGFLAEVEVERKAALDSMEGQQSIEGALGDLADEEDGADGADD